MSFLQNFSFSSSLGFLNLSKYFTNVSKSGLALRLIFGAGAIYAVRILLRNAKNAKRLAKRKALVRKRQLEREDTIKNLKIQLRTDDQKIIGRRKWIVDELSTEQLREKLRSEELKPTEVLEAFQSRALVAQEKTNCITQFVVEAREWCRDLESKYQGRDKPALYGLPFSVKEHIGIKGYDATAGLTQFLFDPMREEGALVDHLRQLGAIPFVLTNIPQTVLSFNCDNPIYGETTNPGNVKMTSGGSSGGEAALHKFRGAAFGVGSDLAGSIRVPSHFCGVAGLKPSSGRLSMFGGRKAIVGRALVPTSWGPMASDVDSLVLFMREVLSEEFFAKDAYMIPIPFRDEIYTSDRKLTIGYYDYDGFIQPVPAVKRALHLAKDVLERAGHRLVPFRPPETEKAFDVALKLLSIDAGHFYYKVTSGELLDTDVKLFRTIISVPAWIRRLAARLAAMSGNKKLAMSLGSFSTLTKELGYDMAALFRIKMAFNAEWTRLGLDALICPPCATVAPTRHLPMEIMPAFLYTVYYNLMDYPGGVVPVTLVTPDDEAITRNTYDHREHYAKLIYHSNTQGLTVGLPVGVQCLARAYNEEMCLRVMKELEDGVKKGTV